LIKLKLWSDRNLSPNLTPVFAKMLKMLLKTTAVLFSIIPLIALNSCSTSGDASSGQLSRVPNWKNLYFFHSGDSTWIVKPVTEAGNQFTGIIYNPEVVRKSRQVHIYAEPLSAIQIQSGRLTVPMENIVKVENHRIGPGIILASIGVVALLFLIPTVL
jgi:hypothetical protein